MKHRLCLTLLVSIVSGCSERPQTLIESGYDEKEMDAAIARARGEVDQFISELAKPTGTNHAVKAPVQDAGKTERFWLTDLTYSAGKFEGTINNEPGIVKNVRMGQKRSVAKQEISDWMYMRGGKMYGNYTMRQLLKAMPDEEAAKFRALLAEP
jgi:uncharacterized protein YegJ (DUF2314 family)